MAHPSPEQLAEAFAAASLAAPVSVEPVGRPSFHTVYRVALEDGSSVALLIGTDGQALRNHSEALTAVAELEIPTVDWFRGLEGLEAPAAVSPWIEGHRGLDRLREAPGDVGEPLWRGVGQVLAQLDSTRSEGTVELSLSDAAERACEAGTDLGITAAILDRMGSSTAVTQVARVHGDLHPGNLLVDDAGSLVCVLDWDQSRVTDPLVDWVGFLEQPPVVLAYIARGFGLDRARSMLLGSASRLEWLALGRLIERLAALAHPRFGLDQRQLVFAEVLEDWHRMQAPGWVEAHLGRALSDRIPDGLPGRRQPRSLVLSRTPDAGMPIWVGMWQRRLLHPKNRASEASPKVDLLSVLGGPEFFDSVWNRQPWVLSFDVPPIDWARLTAELAVQVAGDNRVDRWGSTGMERGVTQLGAVDDVLQAATDQLIAVRDTHWEHEGLRQLHQAFAAYFGCPVTTGLYLNGAGAPGFPEHHDSHHVFALQLSGTKRWKLGGALLSNASRRYDWPGQQQTVSETVDVPAGRMLYLPAGVRHCAEVAVGPSVHVTFGVHVPRALDWLETMLTHAGRRNPTLRAPLSMDPGPKRVRWRVDARALAAEVDQAFRDMPASALLSDGTFVGDRPVDRPAQIEQVWPVSDGNFAVRTEVLDSAALDRATRAAAELVAEIEVIRAVYARGSVLEDPDPATVFDVDLAVVFAAEPTPETLQQAAEILKRHGDSARPFDARPVLAEALMQRPSGSFLGVCLAVRSALLAGEPLWDEPPPIAAGLGTARALAAESIGVWQKVIAQMYATPAPAQGPRMPPEAVAWLQKRALRLVGIASLATGGPFTRHPVGCSRLARVVHPTSTELAERVCAQLIARDGSNEALANAQQLGAELISRLQGA